MIPERTMWVSYYVSTTQSIGPLKCVLSYHQATLWFMHTTSDLDTEIVRTVEDIYTLDADDRQWFPSDLVVKADSFQEIVDEVGRHCISQTTQIR